MKDVIIRFIEKQKCASVCCVDENGNPYCFSCFYTFNAEDGLLYFKSSEDSVHMKMIKIKPAISGTILPDKLQIVVKGIQFQGEVILPHHELAKGASKYYHRKYPFAAVIPGEVWTILLTYIKMTDSSNKFGKKILWQRVEETVL